MSPVIHFTSLAIGFPLVPLQCLNLPAMRSHRFFVIPLQRLNLPAVISPSLLDIPLQRFNRLFSSRSLVPHPVPTEMANERSELGVSIWDARADSLQQLRYLRIQGSYLVICSDWFVFQLFFSRAFFIRWQFHAGLAFVETSGVQALRVRRRCRGWYDLSRLDRGALVLELSDGSIFRVWADSGHDECGRLNKQWSKQEMQILAQHISLARYEHVLLAFLK